MRKGCGGTAVKDFHKFLRICFFILCMFRKGGGRRGGRMIYGAVTMLEFLFLWSGRGGGRLSEVWRRVELCGNLRYDVLMVLRESESVSYV